MVEIENDVDVEFEEKSERESVESISATTF